VGAISEINYFRRKKRKEEQGPYRAEKNRTDNSQTNRGRLENLEKRMAPFESSLLRTASGKVGDEEKIGVQPIWGQKGKKFVDFHP